MWIAGAILGLTLAGACNLNPQPLPPEGLADHAGDDASVPTGTTGPSSSGAGGGSGFNPGGSSGSNSGSGSGSGPIVSDDAGAVITVDASAEDSGTTSTAPVDAAADASAPGDGGSDGAAPDASSDAAVDAGVEDASSDDAAGDAGCMHASDCYFSHPGACNLCTWPLNYPVCVAHECGCACDERDAAGE
jgi:hypothetical protein